MPQATRDISGGKVRPECKADNLTAMWADCLENVGFSMSHNTVGLHDLLKR
jgi:hypothetical protein